MNFVASIVLMLAVLVMSTGAAGDDSHPNVVLILADDLGWADLGCYGGDLHETPHLDKLASQGTRFTNAYAASPVCSPTRAAILTGKDPARLGITIWREGALTPPTNRKLLPAAAVPNLLHSEKTLATHFQSAGYLTALVGKWHLGDADYAPETHGFDVNIGGTHWGAPATFFYPYRGGFGQSKERRYVPHLEFGRPGEYLTDRLTDEALRVIDQAAITQRPFFLYLAHHAPHTPIEARAEDVQHFRSKIRSEFKHQHAGYAAMIRSLDESVGRVLARLDQHHLERDTIVVFTSDNGGYIGMADEDGKKVPVTSNWPLRSGKGTCYEGGLRVPLLIRWSGHQAAGRDCAEPVVLTDLFPTLLTGAGVTPPADRPADGRDLGPLLSNPDATLDRPAVYFHYPHYYFAPPTAPMGAIRAGDWKLVEHFEDGRVELFDLRNDLQESHDLAAAQPARAADLRRQLQDWRVSVGARMPTPNPRATDP